LPSRARLAFTDQDRGVAARVAGYYDAWFRAQSLEQPVDVTPAIKAKALCDFRKLALATV